MRTESYPKSQEPQKGAKTGLVRGAGGTEIAVLSGSIVAGVGIGLALDSVALGFVALIALALLARLVLAILGMDGDTGSSNAPARPHEHVGS